MKKHVLAPVLVAIATFGMDLHDARACKPPPSVGPTEIVLSFGERAPKDATLPFLAGSAVDPSFQVEATDAAGSSVALTIEDSLEQGTRILRAKNGEFPVGKLHVVFTHHPKSDPFSTRTEVDVEISTDALADFAPEILDMNVVATTIPDESSPKVTCHHTVKHSPGDCSSLDEGETQEVALIASRVKKLPQVTFRLVNPAWSSLLKTVERHSTKHADGTITEGTNPGAGVEYCVEVETSPRHVAGTTKKTSRCIPNGDLTFDVTSSDNDDAITKASQSYDCNSLVFPDGVRVPDALEHKSQGGDRGCSTAPGSHHGSTAPLAILGALLALAQRRRAVSSSSMDANARATSEAR